jgi:hypothetical protein
LISSWVTFRTFFPWKKEFAKWGEGADDGVAIGLLGWGAAVWWVWVGMEEEKVQFSLNIIKFYALEFNEKANDLHFGLNK